MDGPTISTTGTLYQLGRHRLLVGDATNPDDVARVLGGNRAAMLLTDPPYNVGYQGKTSAKLTIQGDRQKSADFESFLQRAFAAADGSLREGGAFYVWHCDKHPLPFFRACDATGWAIRQRLMWIKNHFTFGHSDYHWQHEPCLYGWKPGAAHRWHGNRKQSTLLSFPVIGRNRLHPTMKPVPMFEQLIRNSSAVNELVLDTFAGSGTTVLACEASGRQARVLEIDPFYADVIRRRWARTILGADVDWIRATPAIAPRRGRWCKISASRKAA